MPIQIVQLQEGNTGLLARVADDVFDGAVDPSRVAAYVAEPSHLMLLAVAEGVVVGQVLGVVHRHPDKPTELYVDDLAVSAPYQRQGVATRLLRELFALGRARGCEEIWVATEPENRVALAFYRSLGLSPRTAVVLEGALGDGG
jgi:aminoglycoside 6'-N-acetyltransferase I